MAAPPPSIFVMALVLEAHRDTVTLVTPQLLHQPVVELARPLALEEGLYLLAALKELVAVAPHGVLGVGESHPLGVACVPGVLGHLHLLSRSLFRKGRYRRLSLRLLLLLGLLHLPISFPSALANKPLNGRSHFRHNHNNSFLVTSTPSIA